MDECFSKEIGSSKKIASTNGKITATDKEVLADAHVASSSEATNVQTRIADHVNLDYSPIKDGSTKKKDKVQAGTHLTRSSVVEICEDRQIDIAIPGCSKDLNTEQYPVRRNLIFNIGYVSKSVQQALNRYYKAGNDAKEAGSNAGRAAIACGEILDGTEETLEFAKKRAQSAQKKSSKADNLPDKARYSIIASKCNTAANLISESVRKTKSAVKHADVAARLAKAVADEMFDVLRNEPLVSAEEKMSFIGYAINNANTNTIGAKRAECFTLKAMKKCWKSDLVLLGVTADATNTQDQPADIKYKWIIMALTIVLSVLGLVLFILVPILNFTKYAYAAVLTTAIVSTVCALCCAIYRIVKHFSLKKRLAENQKRNAMLNFIDGRLNDLKEYFFNNKISPVPSDEED